MTRLACVPAIGQNLSRILMGGDVSQGTAQRRTTGSRETGRNLRDKTYGTLYERLLSGYYNPGDVLVEKTIAEEFGTSKSPVREAFQRLVVSGYLRVLPRTGYLVKSISAADVVELAHLRALLEGEVAWQAIGRITAEELDELRALAEEAESGGDVLAINRRFHMIIAHAGGNALLEEMISSLLDRAERVLRLDPRMSGSYTGPNHWKIVESLETGDREGARTWMRKHIVDIRVQVEISFPDSGHPKES